jgi:hypothetical protein
VSQPEEPVEHDGQPRPAIRVPPTANPDRVQVPPAGTGTGFDDPEPGESGPVPAEEV